MRSPSPLSAVLKILNELFEFIKSAITSFSMASNLLYSLSKAPDVSIFKPLPSFRGITASGYPASPISAFVGAVTIPPFAKGVKLSSSIFCLASCGLRLTVAL